MKTSQENQIAGDGGHVMQSPIGDNRYMTPVMKIGVLGLSDM